VYQIAQAHGAKVYAHSIPGSGAEFVVELLHAKAAQEIEPAIDMANAEVSGG